MKDIKRIDTFCNDFASLWKTVPDWRFGQLIVNFLSWYGNDVFYLEEKEFLEKFSAFLGVDNGEK